jgi:hypothetical protein
MYFYGKLHHSCYLFISLYIYGYLTTRVGIATSWAAKELGFRFQVGTRDFSLLHNVQTGSRVHPTSCTVGNGTLFLRVKRPGCEADLSPPSSAEVKNGGTIPPLIRLSRSLRLIGLWHPLWAAAASSYFLSPCIPYDTHPISVSYTTW